MASSQNGWPVRTSSAGLESLDWITGRVLPGDVHTIFDYLCRRFDAEVEPIRRDWSWGWAYRPIRGKTSGFSNHAAATAIDLNAPRHPLGRRGTFSAKQAAAIRSILADLDGVIRWGGDYSGRPDEMHFEVNASPARVATAARALTLGDNMTPAELRKALAPELKAIRLAAARQVLQFEVLLKAHGLTRAEIDAAIDEIKGVERGEEPEPAPKD